MEKKEKASRRTHYYSSASDVSKLRIGFLIYLVVFGVVLYVVGKYINLKPRNIAVIVIFVLSSAIYIAGAFAIILRKRQCVLKMTDTEIYYLYGLWSKQKVIVPFSKVQSCQIGDDCFQRACGTVTLRIYTTGDKSKICFKDIKRGQEAVDFIMEKIQ